MPYLIFDRRDNAKQAVKVLTIRHSARRPPALTD
jgi:hypothetical protein